ncbi:MAG: hypothetical protein FIB02_10910 [Desulfuromonas sp.]|nr:hypothetical protein [Desulfuromonas sp.]
MSSAPLLLIVRQRQTPHPELEELTGQLQSGFGLDAYTSRQRLLGPGLAQLFQGEQPQLDSIAVLLRRHGYVCWVIPSPRPTYAPWRLRSLTVGNAGVDFLCEGDKRIRLEQGMTAVGVLADLSGELAGQQVKRMLARNAYLGREQATIFTPEETRQAILKGQPIFDCYLLDPQGAVSCAFRVLPGRFNPEGLGGRASLGAARNLEAVIDLVGEYAGTFRLHTGFGLSQLPGCLPQPARDNPAVLQGNLGALTRYGWLVAGLDEPTPTAGDGDVSPGTVLAAGMAGAAGLTGVAAGADGLRQVAAAVDEAVGDQPTAVRARPATSLPPPPDRPEQRRFSMRQALWAGITFCGGTLAAIVGKSGVLHPFFDTALHTGALPGVAAVACCWGAFACLRLKRFVENTPTSRIRSLAMGLVGVRGRAIRRYALVAPMTQGACVWYRLRKYRRDNNGWKLTSESDSNHVPFVLDDGSGRVVVDPAGATIKVRTEQTGYPGESTLLGAAVEGGPDEKWVEELIYEGTTLYVLGDARPARGVGPGLRERTVDVLRRFKLDPQARRRYDTNGDGRLDADEWQAARDDAERLAAAEQLNEKKTPAVDHVLLAKPPARLPFLIAEGQTGAELAGRYGWIGGVLLALGVAAFGFTLKLALEFFGLL